MGGLGNQIFQLAKALSSERDQPWNCDVRLMRPRLGESGSVEILNSPIFSRHILSPSTTRKIHRITRPSFPLRKIALWLLSNDLDVAPRWKQGLLRVAVPLAGLVYTHNFSKIVIERKIFGRNTFRHTLYIGFFQDIDPTNLAVSLKKMKHSTSASVPMQSDLMSSHTVNQEILVVHLRRGDFASHPTLGMLSFQYYQLAIRKALADRPYDCIWLFSDDVSSLTEFMNTYDFDLKIEIHDAPNLNALTVLELMREGTGFVLSNSTLGWWAAILAHSKSTRIYVPEPWTRVETLNKPPKLENFIGVDSIFE
jgi:hypothetical protein